MFDSCKQSINTLNVNILVGTDSNEQNNRYMLTIGSISVIYTAHLIKNLVSTYLGQIDIFISLESLRKIASLFLSLVSIPFYLRRQYQKEQIPFDLFRN